MRFSWEPCIETGGCALFAHPEEYDGHPSPAALTVDYSPRFASPIRLAAAAVLAFRPFLAGSITFPERVPPELATSIGDFLAPSVAFPGPLEFHPKAMPIGSATLHVEADSTGILDVPRTQTSRLRLTSAGQAFGQHVSAEVTTVPTNACLLEPHGGDDLDRALPYLAVAILLAEDFGVGTLAVPPRLREGSRVAATAAVLSAAGLSLRFDEIDSSIPS